MKKLTCILFLSCLAIGVTVSAETDPFVGKWVMDISRSEYPSGTCPKEMVIEMDTVGKGVHYRSDATYANGSKAHAEYTADYDGNESMVMSGRGLMLPVFLKRFDSHTVVASYTQALVVVATSRRVISEDSRFMTITTTSNDKSGKTVTTVGVYQRVFP